MKQTFKRLLGRTTDKDGVEPNSGRQRAVPVGFRRPETLAEQVARLVRLQSYEIQRNQGRDLDDDEFDYDEDPDAPFSPYELVFDPVLGQDITVHEFMKNQDKYRVKYAQAALLTDPATPLPEDKKRVSSRKPVAPKDASSKDTRPDEDSTNLD